MVCSWVLPCTQGPGSTATTIAPVARSGKAGSAQRCSTPTSATPTSVAARGNAAGGGVGGWDYGGGGAGGGSSGSKDAMFAMSERVAGMLRILPEFASVQHGYLIFLESCDSRALAVALGRCMAGKLHALLASLQGWAATGDAVGTGAGAGTGTGATGDKRRKSDGGDEAVDNNGDADKGGHSELALTDTAPTPTTPAVAGLSPRVLSEQIVAMVTLSSFLSYLTHASHQGGGAADDVTSSTTTMQAPWAAMDPHAHQAHAAGGVPPCSWPGTAVNIEQLVKAGVRCGMLPAIMPCVAQLLWFAHHDGAALSGTGEERKRQQYLTPQVHHAQTMRLVTAHSSRCGHDVIVNSVALPRSFPEHT